ncbi:MAG: ATP-binding protein, partial [Dehalococcoidia bacterium]|nr:ATP-binding protein [Dehalococcoidia bacterium]
RSGIECGCDVPSVEPPLGPDRATAVFRIAQEALTNVARHSGAQHVEIAFTVTDEGVGLEVRDDGKGITEDQVASVRSIGLIGMCERAGSLGGRVYVRPGVERGTIVTLQMPFAGPGLPAAEP